MDEGNMSATKYDATPQTVCQQLGPADEKNGGSSSCCGTASTETVKPSTGFAVGTGRSMSGLPIAVRPAQPDDFSVILSLLAASKLPTGDLHPDGIARFIVAESGNTLVGVCGLDVFGTAGLPRSLAVQPQWRGCGIGERLIAGIEQRARKAGIDALYLLTTTAQAYLKRLGYEDVRRDVVPEAIAAHPQFCGLCPASAKCMSKRLD